MNIQFMKPKKKRIKSVPAKNCLICGAGFVIKSNYHESIKDFEKRNHCNSCLSETNTCMVHELVRIRVGEYYYTIDNKLSFRIDEAKLYHPENIDTKIMTLQMANPDKVVRTESNRN
jgi:hypothetical protein